MNMVRGALRANQEVSRDQILRLFSVSSGEAKKHREMALSYLRTFLKRPQVTASSGLEMVSRQIDAASNGNRQVAFSAYLKFLGENIIPQSSNMASPRCIGHMTSVVPGFVWTLGDLIVGLNQNLVKREASRALTVLERKTLSMLHQAIYGRGEEFYDAQAQSNSSTLGIMTSGATISNLAALWIARNLSLGSLEDFAGIEAEGVGAALAHYGSQQAVIICSSFAHYSIRKAAGILGLGERNVISTPVDRRGRVDLAALQRNVDDCRHRGFRLLAIVATAGTTDCGSIDPLDEVGEIAAVAGTHFHVDAAWGAPLLFSRRYRRKLAGIQRADSVTIDAHKQFYLPIGNSVLLMRHPQASSVIEKQTSYMLQEGSGDLGNRSLEGSRPGSALLLHAALNIIGPRGYGWLIEDNIRKAKVMSRKLRERGLFELVVPPETNIVLYRYIPPGTRKKRQNGALNASDNLFINQLNERIQKTQSDAGRAFVSRTTVENLPGGCSIVALRAVLANPFTTEADIDFVIQDQIEIAEQLLRSRSTVEASTRVGNAN